MFSRISSSSSSSIVIVLMLIFPTTIVNASRAYPHGCLYRHPSYYTYDERDDVTWSSTSNDDDEYYIDFRRLPSKSSKLRRPYTRYKLIRRLGAGKFSNVFEAVDVQWQQQKLEKSSAPLLDNNDSGGEISLQHQHEACGVTTEETDTDDENNQEENTDPDPQSLVALKCLKPVSERKIRRELLILTHCITLPSMARLFGIVLPDESNGNNDEDKHYSASSKKHRRHHHRHSNLQQENIGSITDAAASFKSRSSLHTEKSSIDVANHAKNNKKQQQYRSAGTAVAQTHRQQQPAFVLEHAGKASEWFCHGTQSNTNTNHLSEYEIKYFLCHLLIALDNLHAAGIMHRDVKPRNCLINRRLDDEASIAEELARKRTSNGVIDLDQSKHEEHHQTPTQPILLPPPPLMLVDLGLADFYLPGKEYNVRVSSRHYKSPELLIGFAFYDYAIDMWSVGCILAGLLFRTEPFFRGKDNEDQLGKIVSVLGTRDFLPYCRKCNIRLTSKSSAAIGKYCSRAQASSSSSSSDEEVPTSLMNNDISRRKTWLSFLSSPATPVPSVEALDLLDKLLVYDHEQRWTAREALGHSFFDDVRERVLHEVQERIEFEAENRDRSC